MLYQSFKKIKLLEQLNLVFLSRNINQSTSFLMHYASVSKKYEKLYIFNNYFQELQK